MLLHKGNRGIRHIVSTTNSQKLFMYFIKIRSPRGYFSLDSNIKFIHSKYMFPIFLL